MSDLQALLGSDCQVIEGIVYECPCDQLAAEGPLIRHRLSQLALSAEADIQVGDTRREPTTSVMKRLQDYLRFLQQQCRDSGPSSANVPRDPCYGEEDYDQWCCEY
jgi:hypothetical protein